MKRGESKISLVNPQIGMTIMGAQRYLLDLDQVLQIVQCEVLSQTCGHDRIRLERNDVGSGTRSFRQRQGIRPAICTHVENQRPFSCDQQGEPADRGCFPPGSPQPHEPLS